MTVEEAIKKLKEQQNEFNEHCIDYAGINEAYNMAIKSLEAWEKVKEDILKLEGLRYSSGVRVYQDEVIDIIDKYMKETEK